MLAGSQAKVQIQKQAMVLAMDIIQHNNMTKQGSLLMESSTG